MNEPYIYDVQVVAKKMAYKRNNRQNTQRFYNILVLLVTLFFYFHYALSNLKIKITDKIINTLNMIILETSIIALLYYNLWCIIRHHASIICQENYKNIKIL